LIQYNKFDFKPIDLCISLSTLGNHFIIQISLAYNNLS